MNSVAFIAEEMDRIIYLRYFLDHPEWFNVYN